MAGIAGHVGNYLRNQSEVTDLVTSSGVTWDSRDRNPTLPYVLVQEISANSHEHLGGSSGLTTDRVQIDCVADDAGDADAIREEVRKVMQGFRGTMTSKAVKGCSHDGTSSFVDYPKNNSSIVEYVKTIDFRITYAETVPS